MKTPLSTLIILLLSALLLTACGSGTADTITIGEADAGHTIKLEVGDSLVVALPGNITTGYNWIPAPQEPSLLEQVGEPKVTPASDLLGAPGMIALQFKAASAGQTTLHLDYRRSFEPDVAPEQTFEVAVIVK
jgi:inhibitor of cysteine peptidase